ncbi:peptidase domain-containing ABC transporter [Alteromonas lipotrueiana]|uniref:peptidase domain-containing ABC transporter n=1 Tax=Alteromonas lipotrueiana TaxID=2803815 RepID=UPI001C480B91|nr:peptidase domain-containing ABC transporter [Alteromonas lipotrueiana]
MNALLTLPLQARWSAKCKVPQIFQAEMAECGLACLCMVSQHFGNTIDLAVLRQRFGASGRGLTLKDLMAVAAQINLSARALKIEPEQLKELSLPAILHWDMQHFVVLTQVTRLGIYINDPATGQRFLTYAQADSHLTGVALELNYAGTYQAPETAPRLTLSHFWQRASGLKRSLSILFTLSVLLQLFALASPYYMQTVVDDVLLRHSDHLLTILALGFGLLLLIESATTGVRKWLILSLSSRLQGQMSANLFHHLLHLPADFFSRRHLGDVVSRFGCLAHVREQLTTGLVTALLDGLMTLVMLIVMWLYSPTLTVVVVISVGLYIVLRWLTFGRIKNISAERLHHSATEQGHFLETIRSIQAVKQFNYQALRHNQWQNLLVKVINTDIRLGKTDIILSGANQVIFGMQNLLVIYLGAQAVMGNVFTVGMLYAFISYKTQFTSACDNLITQLIQLKLLRVHLDRLSDLVFSQPETLNYDNTSSPHTPAALCVTQLTYRFSALSAPLFQNINMTIAAGQTIAIIGPSGAGKSTFLKCLMGLVKPDEGTVHYAGQAVHSSVSFRKVSAAVLQDDTCLNGTLLDNITGFDDSPDMARLRQAAHMACLDQEIERMPMQYQTLVGDMGSALSGGQLQRLFLARALYRQPAILFLDEASSHLDLANEARINQHLKAMSITRIIVAHRPQTIALADAIFILENGSLTQVANTEQDVFVPLTPSQGETHD